LLEFVNHFNRVIFVMISVLYFYQIAYVVVSLVGDQKSKNHPAKANVLHRYGVIIAARNESAVIAELIKSIKKQRYPSDLVDIFVVADNCTDNTAQIAKKAGAIVFERFNSQLIGKGYALDFAFKHIYAMEDKKYDGYFIFDADNLLDEHYIAEMNKTFDNGYRVVTSYRNSKNYDNTWISAGYSLWFLREAKFLNNSRMLLKTSCAVSGTGFLVSDEIIRKNNGWKYYLLTEDIEFSIDSAIKGEKIGYCSHAKLYDEQPCTFQQSWTQRLRWSKGFYQVFGKYGAELVKGIGKRKSSFSCYDMLMTVAPAVIVSLICIGVNGVFLIYCIMNVQLVTNLLSICIKSMFFAGVNFYLSFFLLGFLTTITEWKEIKCDPVKKILYTFTFPLFMFTYLPISIVALFKKVEWTPIAHNIVKTLDEVR